ncbi:MAG: RNA 2'-phosphotransferase, partial [Phycisphaerae bacterium]
MVRSTSYQRQTRSGGKIRAFLDQELPARDSPGCRFVSKFLLSRRSGSKITRDELNKVVKENDKQRFSFSEDNLRIRANYGHSIAVDLGYSPAVPPDVLYHGTAVRSLKAIRVKGLTKGNRQYVHLSPDAETARNVGQRHGKPIVLKVLSGQMHLDGH